MQIGVLGLSYKTAPLNHLESVITRSKRVVSKFDFSDFVLLCTCNRVEIYSHENKLPLIKALLVNKSTENFFYEYHEKSCFTHLTRVTAGLESRLIGESEIQGQVKRAYLAHAPKGLSASLHYLFQKSLKNGKEIRTQFPYPFFSPTLEGEVYQKVKDQGSKILLIGASRMQQGIFRYLKRKEVTLTTRYEKEAAKNFTCPIVPWGEHERSHLYDVVIAATQSNQHLIHSLPKKKPLLIDLSVPRVINPIICDYNLDQLQKKVEEKRHFLLNGVKKRLEYIDEKIKIQHYRFTSPSIFAPFSQNG
ncbi:MAG: hypothetical protein WDZ28_04455 [Simkaniaceae bacterium]